MTAASLALNRPTAIAISVVIPCYNGERFLSESIRSALGQTLAPQEVLMIDDGSTDQSVRVASQFGPPVRVIRQSNQGESVARNRGLMEARGDWIAFLDADDLWHPTKLERQAELISDDVVCIHTPYYTFGAVTGFNDRSSVPAAVRYRLEYMSWHPFVSVSSAMVRRTIAARFPTWTRYAEDHVFFLDLLREGRFRQTDALLTGQRRHDSNQSAAAGVERRWHETMLRWLAMRDSRLDQTTIAAVRCGWRQRLARAAFLSLVHGRWNEYRMYAQYLRCVEGIVFPTCRYVADVGARLSRAVLAQPLSPHSGWLRQAGGQS